eukprot:TRINITY_DN6412_c3_g1_i2.p1 TRINITY_DN6412_c3_g1~~TRINITY_DN6412_c3_g1_i2.p1  ORF type:complete len:460 (+),score=13.61 TRINITY_DN6412_c3_g1_i2:79-1380(+)
MSSPIDDEQPELDIERFEASLVIDTQQQTVHRLLAAWPNLYSLNLNNSNIQSIRDLGTSLKNLVILNISCCDLHDLDGVFGLPNIEELYMSFNSVNDLNPAADLANLKVLDAEANDVEDFLGFCQIAQCSQLTYIVLKENPIYFDAHYSSTICEALPQIQMLDDKRRIRSNGSDNYSYECEQQKLVKHFSDTKDDSVEVQDYNTLCLDNSCDSSSETFNLSNDTSIAKVVVNQVNQAVKQFKRAFIKEWDNLETSVWQELEEARISPLVKSSSYTGNRPMSAGIPGQRVSRNYSTSRNNSPRQSSGILARPQTASVTHSRGFSQLTRKSSSSGSRELQSRASSYENNSESSASQLTRVGTAFQGSIARSLRRARLSESNLHNRSSQELKDISIEELLISTLKRLFNDELFFSKQSSLQRTQSVGLQNYFQNDQ